MTTLINIRRVPEPTCPVAVADFPLFCHQFTPVWCWSCLTKQDTLGASFCRPDTGYTCPLNFVTRSHRSGAVHVTRYRHTRGTSPYWYGTGLSSCDNSSKHTQGTRAYQPDTSYSYLFTDCPIILSLMPAFWCWSCDNKINIQGAKTLTWSQSLPSWYWLQLPSHRFSYCHQALPPVM